MILKLSIYFQIFRYCLFNTQKLNLGDVVTYLGHRYQLTQGVNKPYWNIHSVYSDTRVENVHEGLLIKEKSLNNFIHDIRSTYRFYKGYWFDIWLSALRGHESSVECLRHMPRPFKG